MACRSNGLSAIFVGQKACRSNSLSVKRPVGKKAVGRMAVGEMAVGEMAVGKKAVTDIYIYFLVKFFKFPSCTV
jgi:hypothetical protein